ncbi:MULTISPECIES: hypothetical protein [unclassified Microcoleus]|uniref:hypothetical protein n=1 Tax=unclassified Microcoleus TaxID=2642155 RepID=UPI002FD322AD
MVDGTPKYLTASSQSDVRDGWRDRILSRCEDSHFGKTGRLWNFPNLEMAIELLAT